MISAQQALERLQQGNQRYARGECSRHDPQRREAGLQGQTPFAVVLGCSDSRVPVELVFDQDVGDLFVARVAGNVATPEQIGTIEYTAENLGTRLVVVLGHTHCGAVTATLDTLQANGAQIPSPNLAALVDHMRVPVAGAIEATPEASRAALIAAGVRANVRATVERILNDSQSLQHLFHEDGLRIVGAEYALETGTVTFLDHH